MICSIVEKLDHLWFVWFILYCDCLHLILPFPLDRHHQFSPRRRRCRPQPPPQPWPPRAAAPRFGGRCRPPGAAASGLGASGGPDVLMFWGEKMPLQEILQNQLGSQNLATSEYKIGPENLSVRLSCPNHLVDWWIMVGSLSVREFWTQKDWQCASSKSAGSQKTVGWCGFFGILGAMIALVIYNILQPLSWDEGMTCVHQLNWEVKVRELVVTFR